MRYIKLVGTGEIDQAIKKLKNGKAPGPNQVKAEDIKVGDSKKNRNELNEMIKKEAASGVMTILSP